MKITNSALALCLLSSSTSAFVVQPVASGSNSALFESRVAERLNVGRRNEFAGDAGLRNSVERRSDPRNSSQDDMTRARSIWDAAEPVAVQGGSLRTWSFTTPSVERAQVLLKTEGRPLNADIDLWQGPDNTPQKMRVYIEDGSARPFCAVIETPRSQNAIAIRNTGQLEFPLGASVEAEVTNGNELIVGAKNLSDQGFAETIQGGAIKTYSFAPSVASVQILLKTDGRPLNARIELLQGPNNNKQVVELYTEDGMERPFYAVIETPGVGNVVRVLNTAPVEFPMYGRVEPYLVDNSAPDGFTISGDMGGGSWDRGALF